MLFLDIILFHGIEYQEAAPYHTSNLLIIKLCNNKIKPSIYSKYQKYQKYIWPDQNTCIRELLNTKVHIDICKTENQISLYLSVNVDFRHSSRRKVVVNIKKITKHLWFESPFFIAKSKDMLEEHRCEICSKYVICVNSPYSYSFT